MRYSGEQYDSDLGQQYLRARYYNQNNGQFNRLDPYSGNLTDSQSYNKYSYCHGDPVNNVDPTGKWSLGDISIAMMMMGALYGVTRPANGILDRVRNTIGWMMIGLLAGELIALLIAFSTFALAGCGVTVSGALYIDATLTLGSGTALYSGWSEGSAWQSICRSIGSLLGRFKSANRLLRSNQVARPDNIGTKVSQKQYRHVFGRKEYESRNNGQGSYFKSKGDAQKVLDAYHDGSAKVLRVEEFKDGSAHVYIEFPAVTGFNNNPGAGHVNQPTNIFIIKGSSSPSIVPTNPNQ